MNTTFKEEVEQGKVCVRLEVGDDAGTGEQGSGCGGNSVRPVYKLIFHRSVHFRVVVPCP